MIFTLAIPLEYFAQGDYSLRTHKPRREDVLPFAIPLLRPVEPTAATREKKVQQSNRNPSHTIGLSALLSTLILESVRAEEVDDGVVTVVHFIMVLLFSDSLVRSSGVHGPSTPVGLLTGGPAAEALGVLVPMGAEEGGLHLNHYHFHHYY